MKYKTINPKETVFYVFETSTIKFSIFDSEMDEAIYLGGEWNMVSGIVKNIKKQNPNVKLYYYSKSKDNKEKMVLDPFWTNTLKMIIPT